MKNLKHGVGVILVKTDKVKTEVVSVDEGNDISVTPVTPDKPKPKPKPKERKWNGSNKKQGVWLKVYAEQCGFFKEGATNEEQINAMDIIFTSSLSQLSIDYYVDIRIHYLDEVAAPDDPFSLSVEKPHAHIYLEARGNRKRLDKFFNDLKACGISFRKGLDDILLDKQIENGNAFPDYRQGKYAREYCVVYNSHEDMISKKKGKHVYDTDDYHYSTFSRDEIKEMIRTEQIVRNGYLDKDSDNDDIATITKFEHVELLDRAKEVGRAGGDFDEWYFQLPQSVLLQANKNKLIDVYNYWQNEFIKNPLNTDMTRLCLFIVGNKDLGKSGSMALACSDLGLTLHQVSAGGGTGKMDNFKYTDMALGIDDTTVTGLMTYADDRICSVYRRNKGNPLMRCKLLYITYNYSLTEYYWRFLANNTPTEFRSSTDAGLDAFRSRFIEITLNNDGEVSDIQCHLRGSRARIQEKVTFAMTVLDAFTARLAQYRRLKPSRRERDLLVSHLNRYCADNGFVPVPDDEDLPFDTVNSYSDYRSVAKGNSQVPLLPKGKWEQMTIEERRDITCS